MRRIRYVITFLLLVAMYDTSFANDDLLVELQARIQNGCLRKVRNSRPALRNIQERNVERFCSCIANKHYSIAKEKDGVADREQNLQWAADFYESVRGAREVELSRADSIMSDRDRDIIIECNQSVRSSRR